MKSAYIAKYRHGLAGPAVVVAADLEEATHEAVAYARCVTACIPDEYTPKDVVESIEPAEDVRPGAWGYGSRPTVQLETHWDFRRTAAKEAAARKQASDFSKLDKESAAEAAV